MTTELYALIDRIVTDEGDVVAKHDMLLRLARDGVKLDTLSAFPDPRIDRYNSISDSKINTWSDDGDVNGPSDSTYDWLTPEPWKSSDVWKECRDKVKEFGDEYSLRLEEEISGMEERDMLPLVRHLSWMVSDFRERKVVWGGRGSSCASLVLFLIGFSKVDPVKYDIPLEEFLK